MQKESSLIQKLKKFGKTSAKIAVGTYMIFVATTAGTESYYIVKDKINSSQSYTALRYSLSYNKNIPDITKTLFSGIILAHAINIVSNFGEEKLF